MTRNPTPYMCFFTDSEVANSFCLRYWARSSHGKWDESFRCLLSDSGLSKSEMIGMLKAACRLYFPEVRCGSCADRISVATRSEYSALIGMIRRYRTGKPSPWCSSCSTGSVAPKPKIDLLIPRQQRDRVLDELKRQHDKAKPVDYTKLSYFQSCLLYTALLAANIAPGQTVVPPLETQMDDLAPTLELADEIYAHLCTDRIFLPALSSNLDAFSLDKDTNALMCNIRAGAWTLADDVCGRSTDEILALLFRKLDQPEPDAIKALWYLVAESECRRYFVTQWERYNFAHANVHSAKVSGALRNYFEQCSIGELWNVVYYAVKNLAALTQEGRHTLQHIYNMLPGAVRRYADYRLANGQSIRPWNRPFPPTASWMTNILLDKILKGGDIAFKLLKGQDVTEYVEYLVTKPRDHDPLTWFVRPKD